MTSLGRSAPVKAHAAPEETLVKGRAKRSTAGNRMRALLDSELEADTGFEEIEDDVDFVGKEEEDAFDNDFASTDEEEGANDDEDAGEKDLRRQEKQARKFSRSNPTKDPSMAYLKPRAQPKAMHSSLDRSVPSPAPRAPPRKSRISFAEVDTIFEGGEAGGEGSASAAGAEGEEGEAGEGGDVEAHAEGEEPIEGEATEAQAEKEDEGETRRRRRASGRTATVAFKSEVDARLAAEAEERSKTPHRYKQPAKKARYTQDELIEEALFTEEMNNESLQDWLEKEEARRLALRVVRKKLEGPTVSWISRDSQKKLVVEIKDGDGDGEGGEKLDKGKGKEVEISSTASALKSITAHPYATTSSTTNAVAGPSRLSPSNSVASPSASTTLLPGPPSDERHARNFVLLEPAPATWSKELRVLFGSHVSWSKMKVVPARNRPQTRRPTLCPLTGLPALYLDPRSGVPYANLSAYKTLTSLLEQQWKYSSELGAYVGGGGVKGADGVPEEWDGREKEEREREEARGRAREKRMKEEEERRAVAAAAAALAGEAMVVEEEAEAIVLVEEEEEEEDEDEEVETPEKKKRRKRAAPAGEGGGRKRRKKVASVAPSQ
ncbi:YL1 nuclear protein-domain-containing protein [Mrakia frigida]|uniref:Vps72/YL1 family protein n=1 Tax=Mrakia frigida TaxID=29902 RepID=UPI003FCC102D